MRFLRLQDGFRFGAVTCFPLGDCTPDTSEVVIAKTAAHLRRKNRVDLGVALISI